ncbi:MAG: efflux RND transporter permease subunit [Saprospiraceae bacterium]
MASLSSISIRRPVLATVFSIVILLFGIIGFTYLGVREYPSVDPPIITVSTNYVGANADIIESQITERIEEVASGIAGIRSMTSVSRDGRSTITIEFDLEVNIEAAANDVRDKVAQAQRFLPPDADPPTVSKADADSSPILFLNIQSETRSLLELSEMAETLFKERLQTIKGVSQIFIWGQKRYSMRLWIDPDRLVAYNLTPLDIRNALQSQNIELPSGSVEGNVTELTVRTSGRLESVEDFNNLVIKENSGSLVRFRDVGKAELGPENLRTVLKRDGVPMVGNAIVPQPGSNHIEIAEEFYKRLEQIKKDLPADIKLGIGFDSTKYIRASIEEVQQTIYLAFGLVALIIFLFLRDWRTTIIPILVIPISLIGSFFVMYAAGFSINVLTLLGIVLAIGLVVDDAVVVLENIYTKIENGMEPLQASYLGAKEIFFAVIATTVALVAVFLPVIFLQGLTGRLFREFGVTIAGAVLISSFVALTLTPMLAAKILKRRERQNFFYRLTEPFFVGLTNGYRWLLNGFMRVRWLAWFIMLGAGASVYYLYDQIPSELAPLEDRSRFRAFSVAPEGSTFEFMDDYVDNLIKKVNETAPEMGGIITVTSPGFGASTSVNSSFLIGILKPPSQRERSQSEVVAALTPEVQKLTGARTFVSEQQSIGNRRGGLPVQFVVQAPSFAALKEKLPQFVNAARNEEMFSFVDVNLKFNKPELKIEIDRQKAQDLGVSVLDIAQTLQLGLSGQRFGYFIMSGKQYQVIGQVSREQRNEPVEVRSLYVRNKADKMIQLDNLITMTEQTTPPSLYRYNRFVSATVSAGLVKGKTIGDGIEAMERIAAKELDERFITELAGASKDFVESSSSLAFAFGLALILIYLVLSAQFESFRDPFIIMFTVPLAIAGALLSLWFYGQTLNIFSQIGIIMLIGLVSKNGILIVEFANQRKAQGMSKMEAIKDAAAERFRPILMTSLSTILGILPIALALGAGSESRVSMGIAVVGGLVFATILTLLVIPAIYSYLSSKDANVVEAEVFEKEMEAVI